MKKLFVAVIAILLPMMGNAQLMTSGSTTKVETISSARFAGITLNRDGDHYYLAISSSNQFDNGLIFRLGESKDSAIKTLQDLLETLTTIQEGEYIKVLNGWNTIRLYRVSGSSLGFSNGESAGTYWISKGEIKKFLSALE